MSKTSKIVKKKENFNDMENQLKSLFSSSRLTDYNLIVFQRIYKKLVTVRKILKRSLKWDQSGISSFMRSKVMSKTKLIVQKMEKFNDLYLREVKK